MANGPGMRGGAGCFEFPDAAAGSRGHVTVFSYVPERVDPDANILFALHGLDRAASGFRDGFIGSAERHGRIVVVPEFDGGAFPGVFAYNYGNVIGPPPDTRLNHRSAWSFGLIDRLFAALKRATRCRSGKFDLYGNSAGSQFVLRYAALNPAPFLHTAVASNSGIYMLPDLRLGYPAGMGGVGLTEEDLRRYLSRRVRILLGATDTDANAPDLPRGAEAAAQGPHRLARGLWHFERCNKLAEALGTDFGWTVEIVPDAGHVSQALFDRAVAVLGPQRNLRAGETTGPGGSVGGS